jgi:hypothetical protein
VRPSVAGFAFLVLIVSACGSHRFAGNVHEDCYFDDFAAGDGCVGTRTALRRPQPYPVAQG